MTSPEHLTENTASDKPRIFNNPNQLGRRLLIGVLVIDAYVNSFFLTEPPRTEHVPTESEQIVGEVIRYYMDALED